MLNQLFIIRHGYPEQGVPVAYDRPPGPPLSQQGRTEAHEAAQFLRGMCVQSVREPLCIERMLVSPLERTLDTARELAPVLGLSFQVEPALAEHRNDEEFDTVKARLREWLTTLMDGPASCVAVVTHGSPIRALLQLLSRETVDLTKRQFAYGNPAPTAGIWSAARRGDDWRLELVFIPQTTTEVV